METPVTAFVIGTGAREHAIALALKASAGIKSVFAVPGSAGMSRDVECVEARMDNLVGLFETVHPRGYPQNNLTVVGPEALLGKGLVDIFTEQGCKIIGPGQEGAQLETSKLFARRFMDRHGIPGPMWQSFEEVDHAIWRLRQLPPQPCVIKSDGLAAGKGVIVVENPASVEAALVEMRRRHPGRIILEQLLPGVECSFTVLVDVEGGIFPFPSAMDYKRLKDGDRGPNTGGMGGYAPHHLMTPELTERVMEEIVRKAVAGLRAEKIYYCGFMKFDLMLTGGGPKVLEINVRLGDPEAAVILPLLGDRFGSLLTDAIDGRLGSRKPEPIVGTAVSVVVASGRYGYPDVVEDTVPLTIEGIDRAREVATVLHAGHNTFAGTRVHARAGRVLTVVGRGSYAEARKQAYDAVDKIYFPGMQFRKDIAANI